MAHARRVASWSIEAGDKTQFDRVVSGREYNWNRRGQRLRRLRRGRGGRGDDHDITTNQIGRQRRQSVVLVFCPAILDRHVLTLDVAGFLEPKAERGDVRRTPLRRCAVEKSDQRRLLLRAHCKRPRDRCAANERDERAPVHSITSSARESNVGGTSRPSAFAVVRFTTRSNLVGCSTGRSPGFAPRRILSTNSAARRNRSGKFGP